MPALKLQGERALKIIPSDTIGVPNISSLQRSAVTTGTTSDKLVDSQASFTSSIEIGAIVYNTTDSTCAVVEAVDSGTVLSLSADIMTSGEDYKIFNSSAEYCLFYIGVSGDVNLVTSGSDSETFKAMSVGFQPLTIKQVMSTGTTATDIIAIW